MKTLAPRLIDDMLLIPRVTHWPSHGWRGEVVVDDLKMGDIKIGPFVATREEAHERTMASINSWPNLDP